MLLGGCGLQLNFDWFVGLPTLRDPVAFRGRAVGDAMLGMERFTTNRRAKAPPRVVDSAHARRPADKLEECSRISTPGFLGQLILRLLQGLFDPGDPDLRAFRSAGR